MHRRIVAGSRVVDKQRWPHAERLERKREREARNKPEVTEISSVRLSLFISAYKYILTNGLLRVMMRLPFEDGRYAWLRLALLRSSFITKPVVLALVPKWWEEARTVSPRRNEVERPLELEESQRLGRFRIGPRFSYFRTLSTARSLDQTPLYWEAPSSSIRLWQNGVTLSNLSIGNLIGNWQRNLFFVVSHLLFPSWCRAGRSITCREFRLSSPIGNVPFWCSVTARNKHKKCVYPILCGGPYKSCVIEYVWRRLAAETHVQANRVRPLAVLLRAASCVGLISPCGCFHFCVTKETGENQRDTTNSRLLLVFLFLLPYSLPSVNSGRIWLFISWIHFFLNR